MVKVAREIERQKLDEEIKTCRPTNSHSYNMASRGIYSDSYICE